MLVSKVYVDLVQVGQIGDLPFHRIETPKQQIARHRALDLCSSSLVVLQGSQCLRAYASSRFR